MLKQAAERVVQLAVSSAHEHFQPLVKELMQGIGRAEPAQAAEALGVLGEGIGLAEGERSALLATISGAMVEAGADPGPLVVPLLDKLGQVVPAARRFHAACAATAAEAADDPPAAFERAAAQVAAAMPIEAAAWGMLDKLFPPVIAVMSASPAARALGAPLLEPLDEMAAHSVGAAWMAKMVRVLENEPFLAIEPATGRGIAGRMSGIAENFQLNVLLMDAFPRGLLARRRVSADAVRVAKGDGPQQSHETVTGAWNLYTWAALSPDGTLPAPTDLSRGDAWIWNEGVPADIPVFEAQRVILLGPPAYARSWDSQRAFARLRAELRVERTLTRVEVRERLEQMAAAVDR
jgi:hypothetical protein